MNTAEDAARGGRDMLEQRHWRHDGEKGPLSATSIRMRSQYLDGQRRRPTKAELQHGIPEGWWAR
jgi:hypothetical protein